MPYVSFQQDPTFLFLPLYVISEFVSVISHSNCNSIVKSQEIQEGICGQERCLPDLFILTLKLPWFRDHLDACALFTASQTSDADQPQCRS